jgi:hypothetical protein
MLLPKNYNQHQFNDYYYYYYYYWVFFITGTIVLCIPIITPEYTPDKDFFANIVLLVIP